MHLLINILHFAFRAFNLLIFFLYSDLWSLLFVGLIIAGFPLPWSPEELEKKHYLNFNLVS